MEAATFSGSSKRGKAPGNMAQIAQCLVDGCNADLSQCREYHRRHKVCESHSKTPKVTIGGREQRFCQQCSRFHALTEFDEEKRSCRKRLDGHNRRRRKPQSETLSRNPELFFSSQEGARLLSFGSAETFTSSSWAGVANAESNMLTYNNQADLDYIVRQNSYRESSTHRYKEINQFQFMLSTEQALPEASICQPIHQNSASANSNCSQKTFSDGLNQIIDSDRALSLLSSAPTATREIGLNHMMPPDSMQHHAQSLPQNLHFSNIGQYASAHNIESKPVISLTESQVTNNSNLHFQDVFHNGPDGSSTSGSQQTITFMWE